MIHKRLYSFDNNALFYRGDLFPEWVLLPILFNFLHISNKSYYAENWYGQNKGDMNLLSLLKHKAKNCPKSRKIPNGKKEA